MTKHTERAAHASMVLEEAMKSTPRCHEPSCQPTRPAAADAAAAAADTLPQIACTLSSVDLYSG
jgi:hypothetical protein